MACQKINPDSVVVVSTDQISADLADEAAILNLKSGTYYGLDPVGARIWQLIQDPRTVADIHALIVAEYDVDATQCAVDLLAFLEELASEGLVQVNS